jgi:long-chain acyl-CoA synthetase
MIRMEDAGAIKRRMFHACMDVARRVGPALMDGKPVGGLDRLKYAWATCWCTARCATTWA